VLESGRFVLEEELTAFEEEFAAYCGARRAVGVASGTDAIAIALRALGIAPGDEVVVPANTCPASVAGVEAARARPVLADVEPVSYGLDPARLERALTPRTRAVLVVHMYGQCADMEALNAVARDRGLWVVEDAAHAHGSEYRGRRAGTLGDAAAFSFYPTKNLGALGDGGAVVTNDHRVADRARLLRCYGQASDGRVAEPGMNSRLDALQAAFLRAKLPRLEGWNERRRELAADYRSALAETDLTLPVEATERRHVYHHFVVQSERRARLQDELQRAGIETRVHYPVPIHHHPAYASLGAGRDLRVSERLCGRVLSLPLYPELTSTEQERVVEEITRLAPAAALVR
jgi:dTDP-4-amino-4,6-dideoxygalactose transaminase